MLQNRVNLRDYFAMGSQLANKHGLGSQLREKFPEIATRNVEIRVLKPDPDIPRDFDYWLNAYMRGMILPGGVEENSFCIFVDPTTDQMHVADSYQVKTKSVTFLIAESAVEGLASRKETVWTALSKGWDVRALGTYAMRDIMMVDSMLDLLYGLFAENGMDLVELFGGKE